MSRRKRILGLTFVCAAGVVVSFTDVVTVVKLIAFVAQLLAIGLLLTE